MEKVKIIKMKYFATICVLFALTSTEYVVKTREDLLGYREACVRKLNISDSNVELYKKWDFPNDTLTQCYIKCVFIKFDLFDEENGFKVENIHQQLIGNGVTADHDDALHGKIEGCVDNNEKRSNVCEWAYRGATCFIKENLQLVKESVKPL